TIPSVWPPRSVWESLTAASVFGPKSPSTAPGSVAGVEYFFRPFCNAVTTLPDAPRDNSGVFGSAGSACHVIGPTMPSTVKPAPCWKSLTAWSVVESKVPVMLPGASTFIITKRRCSLRTSRPVEPILIVGPLFMVLLCLVFPASHTVIFENGLAFKRSSATTLQNKPQQITGDEKWTSRR